jgi:hypothetical protein
MSRYYDAYPPYVPVAQRRINAQKELQKLQKKGRIIEPLGELSHRSKIATSFWGSAWCKRLESFSDYENRLPRGRTYVRNGSVLHLAITPGRIEALVQGSSLYEQTITIKPLPAAAPSTPPPSARSSASTSKPLPQFPKRKQNLRPLRRKPLSKNRARSSPVPPPSSSSATASASVERPSRPSSVSAPRASPHGKPRAACSDSTPPASSACKP